MREEWRGSQLSLSARDLALWEQAESKIQANRRGGVIIKVVDHLGHPLKGVPLRYTQRKHSFRLGVHYPYHAQVYDLLQEAGINEITLLLGWKYVQPEPSLFNWEYLEQVWNPAIVHRRGLALYAHAINWFKPDWHVLPAYLYQVPKSEFPQIVYEHVAEIVHRWAPYIHTYELVNEPFWTEAHAFALTLEEMVHICHATALAIRDTLPDARLEINFAEVSRLASYRIRPLEFLDALERAGVPYDVIGLQALENCYTVTHPPKFFRAKTLAGIIQTIHRYAQVGKPLHISALCAPSEVPPTKPPSYFRLPYGPWDETKQAHYLDAAYTLLFAEEEVEGITWWCPVDGRLAFVPGGGLLRQDLTPKPSYWALKNWFQRHTSEGQLYTDEEGKAIIQGFTGSYDIFVGTREKGKPLSHEVKARVVDEITVVL